MAYQKIYALKWNNYYNRIVKPIDILDVSLNDFILHTTPAKISFNPNDEISTTQVLNYPVNAAQSMPDYIVVCDEYDNIISRWFIIEAQRQCVGQWLYYLRRDVLVDFYDKIVNADCFIQKATLPETNPLIFNNEGINLNKIKKSEKLLKDKSGCAWIVGYYDASQVDSGTTVMSANIQEEIRYDIGIDGTFDTWEFYGNTSENKIKITAGSNGLKWQCGYTLMRGMPQSPVTYSRKYIFNGYDSSATEKISGGVGTKYSGNLTSGTDYSGSEIYAAMWLNNTRANVFRATNNLFNADSVQYNKLLNYNNKIIRCSDGNNGYRYFRINVYTGNGSAEKSVLSTDQLFEYLSNGINALSVSGNPGNEDFKAFWQGSEAWYSAQEISVGNIAATVDQNRYKLSDAPYSMFAIPFGDVSIAGIGGQIVNVQKDKMFVVACELLRKYSGANAKLFDVQLLPYCPIQKIITGNGINLNNDALLYDIITQTSGGGATTNIGVILYAQISSFTFDIDESITIENVKIENECDSYRLVSPNFNGQFEFNAAKNGGVSLFNVDCSYKPFQPYIHVNPNFGQLYGADFNDARGLICGGDFSLPAMSEAWATYERQNKNYNDIFNRQIENLEINQGFNRIEAGAGAVFGTLSGMTSGAAAGAAAGGVGALIGGVVGGIASAAGGIADYEILKRRQQEELDFRKDEHALQLGNIQALPASLTKVSAFNYNNKIFPILEYYTCTDIEVAAVARKIAWEGMSVYTFGKISDYIINSWSYGEFSDKGFIKAELMRIDISDDFHVVAEIAKELTKGAYYK